MYYDRDFLLELDKVRSKTVYARITALTFDERPIETVEGKITQGSVSVDGSSALRRTCSLTIVAQDVQYNDYYWGLNTKFKLEVGLENVINSNYPDIIWFNQGIYVLTSFSTAHNTNSYNITLQGKDKMCLLNGEVGGSLTSSIDFGTIEEEVNGIWTITKIPIKTIIKTMVNFYAGEPYHNIVINDLDDYGLELLEYRYDVPMYLYRSVNSDTFDNILMNGSTVCYVEEIDGTITKKTLDELDTTELDMLVDTLKGSRDPRPICFETDGDWYYVAKIEYGQTAGYRQTELTYAGDLIANIGESVTSILDKIRDMLSEFEYFYDVDGQFVFQKKKSFVNTLWTPIAADGEGETYVDNYMHSSAYSYVFNEGELISAFNNKPDLLNMRNDYSVWGQRTGASGAAINVHMRYAIDNKPEYYKACDGTVYVSQDGEFAAIAEAIVTDWRELIYQMAKDYYKHNEREEYVSMLMINNGDLYPYGRTGYEQYYSDLEAFWRDLYNPELDSTIEESQKKVDAKIDEVNTIKRKVDQYQRYLSSNEELSDEELAQAQLNYTNAVQELAVLESELAALNKELDTVEKNKLNYFVDDILDSEKLYWNRAVYERPETLNFWFDFLDQDGELSQFNVKNVGTRTKAVNESSVKSIYFRETPEVIFKTSQEEAFIEGAYKYIQIPSYNIEEMFSISAQGKSAKDKIDELIYQHSYCIESATITTIPIYYLQPNTRVYIRDDNSGLCGDYIISKMTIPLAHNGQMSITATKAAENII